MVRAPWLGDVLEDAGLDVLTPAGNPIGRGREMSAIYGVVGHDTVTPDTWSDADVDALLRDGRPGVPGPLSQLGVDRDGCVRWIADGRCNHNGHGFWGNNAIGIEVYCAGALAGREEPWNHAQRVTVVWAARAILDYLGHPEPSSRFNPRVAGHRETDSQRKVDPHRVDLDRLRIDVAERRPTAPEPDDQEDEMIDVVLNRGRVWLIDHPHRLPVPEKHWDYYLNLARSGANRQYAGPHEWDDDRIARHPEKAWD